MKTAISLAVIVCCVLGVVWAVTANERQEPKPSEVEALRDRVKALEDRVAALEGQVHMAPRLLRTPPHVPERWQPREFNGITYYVIPIEQDPNGQSPRR